MEIPDTLMPALKLVGGFVLFVIGISFAWKFLLAALQGKLAYWSGLEKFGFIFIPITWFLSPLLIHLPFDSKKSLIHETQHMWVHLVWGPAFFVLALMFMTSGSDLMGLPGSNTLNTVLTLGRTDIPPCIVYTPPFNYRFPFVRKATKTVLRFLTHKIPQNAKDSYNAYEQKGEDTSQYSKFGGDLFYDDDDDKAEEARQQQAQEQAEAAAQARAEAAAQHKH